MTTWTCKGLLFAVVGLAGAGCDAVDGLNFFDLSGTAETTPLATADLAMGAVSLVPPAGFCVDPNSLQDSFALLARCDVWGGQPNASIPRVVITATIVPTDPELTVVASDLHGPNEVLLTRQEEDVASLIYVEGAAPIEGVRNAYWRGAGQVNQHIVGLALYEADGSPPLGADAPALLTQTMQRTLDRSTQVLDNSATLDTNPG